MYQPSKIWLVLSLSTIAVLILYTIPQTLKHEESFRRKNLELPGAGETPAAPPAHNAREKTSSRRSKARQQQQLIHEVIPRVTSPSRIDTSSSNADTRKLGLIYKGESNDVVLNAKMSLSQADSLYYRFVFHRHYVCEDFLRMGESADGGWDVCLAGPYRFNSSCLVYSFGMSLPNHRRGPNIWFYQTGLGKFNGERFTTRSGWKMRNFKTLLHELGDADKIIDYLKIDIEGYEWKSLESMLETDILKKQVKQLGIEIHLMHGHGVTTMKFYRRWKIMKQLEDIGFRRWYVHFNHFGAYSFYGAMRTCCYEMVYINTAFLK